MYLKKSYFLKAKEECLWQPRLTFVTFLPYANNVLHLPCVDSDIFIVYFLPLKTHKTGSSESLPQTKKICKIYKRIGYMTPSRLYFVHENVSKTDIFIFFNWEFLLKITLLLVPRSVHLKEVLLYIIKHKYKPRNWLHFEHSCVYRYSGGLNLFVISIFYSKIEFQR